MSTSRLNGVVVVQFVCVCVCVFVCVCVCVCVVVTVGKCLVWDLIDVSCVAELG